MQTINEYLYKAKVLSINPDNIELQFDCGFYLHRKEYVSLFSNEFVPLRSPSDQGRVEQISLVIGQEYYFKSLKPNAIGTRGIQQINLDTNQYNVQILSTKPKNYFYKAIGVSCHDGDTFKAMIDLGFNNTIIMDIRLQGINTPELSTGQPGLIAKQFLQSKIIGKNIILETFKNNQQFEKYGRYLALAYEPTLFRSADTVNSINAEMLKLKLGVPMSY